MLRFRLFGIPVLVDWWFWVSAVLMGGGTNANSPAEWSGVAVVCAVMFISIIVHELGHALAGRNFGAHPAIKLHAFGGLTFLPGASFSRMQSIWVSAAGPFAGLALWAVFFAIDYSGEASHGLLRAGVRAGLYINLVWTLFNLLPIQPLDGGQILREILGPRRKLLTSMIGGVLAVVVCVWSLLDRQLFTAIMLALLAYHNFRQQPVEGGVIKG
ncbi:MAG: hypothetical protein EXS31_05555 [Pedosphaera sp.]|nr:hypothetical protein [Pedosphaera sp.]